jgi:Na+/H+-dicarboxylate symporter
MKPHVKILVGMLVGLCLGLLVGPNAPLMPKDAVNLPSSAKLLTAPAPDAPPAPLAKELKQARILDEQDHQGQRWLHLAWILEGPQLLKLKSANIPEAQTLEDGHEAQAWVQDDPSKLRRHSTLGAELVSYTEWLGKLFLALIKMTVVPLVFFSLVVGVASLGDLKALGRLGSRTLAYFVATTAAAVTIGVGLARLIEPGRFVSAQDKALLLQTYTTDANTALSKAAAAAPLVDQLLAMIPSNPAAAFAQADMLQIITFALLLGVALTMLKPERAQPVIDLCDRLNDAVTQLVHLAMRLAPIGVAALLFKVVGSTGPSVLAALAVYAGTVALGLFLQAALVYAPVIRFGANLSPWRFALAIKEVLMLAFSTSSSNATLPVTLEVAERDLNIPPKIASFVLPLGATVNMDGTALYQGVAALFIAQLYGIDLSTSDQLTVILSATLASIGAAGVPGAGMITLVMVLTSVGIPTEGIALILGVDRILDMMRTTINVVGDLATAALMARLEGTPASIREAVEVGDTVPHTP